MNHPELSGRVGASAARWRGNLKSRLEVLALTAVIATSSLLGWRLLTNHQAHPSTGPVVALPREPLSIVGAASKGSDAAPVVLIAFSDFQCPYCERFVDNTLPGLARKYLDTGKVMLVFRHLPLASIHPLATKAAEAAECAGAEGQFWQMHDLLFENAPNLTESSVAEYAATLGLSEGFRECLQSGVMKSKIKEDSEFAEYLGVRGTPSFLIGRREEDGRVRVTHRLAGTRSLSQFEEILKELLR